MAPSKSEAKAKEAKAKQETIQALAQVDAAMCKAGLPPVQNSPEITCAIATGNTGQSSIPPDKQAAISGAGKSYTVQ